MGDDAYAPGRAEHRGGAWAAKLVAGNRFDLQRTTLLAELTAAAAAGATVHSNSWHSKRPDPPALPASYDTRSAEVDAFTWSDESQLVLGSSGNSGEFLGSPGTAKNAICVSAATSSTGAPALADGSSGPTAEGRRKPDLMTVGCGIFSAVVGTGCATRTRPCASSWATPHAAAAAALVRQYFAEGFHPSGARTSRDAFTPSGALLKAVLLNATRSGSSRPNDSEGWGVVQLERSLFFVGGRRRMQVWDVRNLDGPSVGETRTHAVHVVSDDEPLKITLVWTEPPGTVGARPIVNDLDLRVTSPDGAVLLGNVFSGGFSVKGGASDSLNNVEMVLVERPAAGTWTLTVHATEVNVRTMRQGFALVATGRLAAFADPTPAAV